MQLISSSGYFSSLSEMHIGKVNNLIIMIIFIRVKNFIIVGIRKAKQNVSLENMDISSNQQTNNFLCCRPFLFLGFNFYLSPRCTRKKSQQDCARWAPLSVSLCWAIQYSALINTTINADILCSIHHYSKHSVLYLTIFRW